MANLIDLELYEKILSKTMEEVSLDKYSFAAKGKEDIQAYLDTARLSETEKAQVYANWVAQVTTTAISGAMQAATTLCSANAELSLRDRLIDDEIAKIQAEVLRINAEKDLANAQKDKVLADKSVSDAQEALLVQQTVTELAKTKPVTAGVESTSIMKYEADAKNAQAVMWNTYPAQKTLDGISQIQSMAQAAGATSVPYVTQFEQIAVELAARSGITVT